MGKFKSKIGKSKVKSSHPSKDGNAIKRRQHSQKRFSKDQASQKIVKERPPQQQRRPPKVPFDRHDNILLVGEGDFSFALSLFQNYKPTTLTATCYDGEDRLLQKYPKVKDTLQLLVGRASKAAASQEERPTSNDRYNSDAEDQWEGLSPKSGHFASVNGSDEENAEMSSRCQVLYNIDATKLSTTHRKKLRSEGPFTKIVFNFPHVGGLSTDVNRQVRANQQLLVGFFNAAKPLLSSLQKPQNAHYHDGERSDKDNDGKTGHILVVLFEGEPYTLWNIRDLARHCGLQVVESFKFPWHAYPGYQHARTLGDITSGKDRGDEDKRKGAWRGEERDARCYVLQILGDADSRSLGSRPRKRGRADASDDDTD